jgi:hypothetical protein
MACPQVCRSPSHFRALRPCAKQYSPPRVSTNGGRSCSLRRIGVRGIVKVVGLCAAPTSGSRSWDAPEQRGVALRSGPAPLRASRRPAIRRHVRNADATADYKPCLRHQGRQRHLPCGPQSHCRPPPEANADAARTRRFGPAQPGTRRSCGHSEARSPATSATAASSQARQRRACSGVAPACRDAPSCRQSMSAGAARYAPRRQLRGGWRGPNRSPPRRCPRRGGD